jgi:hypothetical protein
MDCPLGKFRNGQMNQKMGFAVFFGACRVRKSEKINYLILQAQSFANLE